jgi:hypothetical protein
MIECAIVNAFLQSASEIDNMILCTPINNHEPDIITYFSTTSKQSTNMCDTEINSISQQAYNEETPKQMKTKHTKKCITSSKQVASTQVDTDDHTISERTNTSRTDKRTNTPKRRKTHGDKAIENEKQHQPQMVINYNGNIQTNDKKDIKSKHMRILVIKLAKQLNKSNCHLLSASNLPNDKLDILRRDTNPLK